MCLGVPGKVVEVFEEHGLRMARVDFGGVTRRACLEYMPDAGLGDYVIIHVGFAISKVDEEEARRVFEFLAEMGDLREAGIPGGATP
ncbi:MAG: HypC/HybG/HupF family hydrogenase formation chaperone [Acidobacteria bacterium]|nr:HypC/HybG/HupF family hydrogenase formation chaperone [Acidobacteriota bacterium]